MPNITKTITQTISNQTEYAMAQTCCDPFQRLYNTKLPGMKLYGNDIIACPFCGEKVTMTVVVTPPEGYTMSEATTAKFISLLPTPAPKLIEGV